MEEKFEEYLKELHKLTSSNAESEDFTGDFDFDDFESDSVVYDDDDFAFDLDDQDFSDYELDEPEWEFLQKRGFTKIVNSETNQELISSLVKQLSYIEKKKKIVISMDNINRSTISSVFRELEETKTIDFLCEYIEKQNEKFVYQELNWGLIPPKLKDFAFNVKVESEKFDFVRVVFDVENDDQQRPTAVGCYNINANRLVFAILVNDENKLIPSIDLFNWKGTDVILLKTINLWEGMLFTDIENVIAQTLQTALNEGQNELVSLLKEVIEFTGMEKLIPIRTNVLTQFLDPREGQKMLKSIWIAHNAAGFDVNMMNRTAKHAKQEFSFLTKKLEQKKMPLLFGHLLDDKAEEKVKSSYQKKGKEAELKEIDSYTINLGNIRAGFNFAVKVDSRYGYEGMVKVTLTTAQKGTFSSVFFVDTYTLASALQTPSKSLLSLSKGLKYEKIHELEDKRFHWTDFDITQQTNEIKLECKYLLFDLLSNLCVYENLSHQINLTKLERILSKIYQKEIVIRNVYMPFTARICSTATIAKATVFAILEAICFDKDNIPLRRDQIENNIVHERLWQKNEEMNYSGGRTESHVYGLVESHFCNSFPSCHLPLKNLDCTCERIYYDDYASLYPHTAWLSYTEKMYQLASEGRLHKFILFGESTAEVIKTIEGKTTTKLNKSKNLLFIEAQFWRGISKLIQHLRINRKTNIDDISSIDPKIFFNHFMGTAHIKINEKIHVLLRVKHPKQNRRMDRYETGHASTTLPDLAGGIIDAILAKDIDLQYLRDNISFIEANYYNLASEFDLPSYGNEFYSALYQERNVMKKVKKIKKKVEEIQKSEITPEIKQHLDQMIEFIDSSDYKLDTDFELKSLEQTMKYNLNSSTGITLEGIDSEDHTGILFIPSIFVFVTSIARLLMRITEALVERLGGLKLYTDTDSLIYKLAQKHRLLILKIFEKTCELKEETDYGVIKKILVLKKKKYIIQSEFSNEPDLNHLFIIEPDDKNPNITQEHHIVGKIHGKGLYPRAEFTQAVFGFAQKLFDQNHVNNLEQIAKEIAPQFPLLQRIRYKTSSSSIIGGINKLYNRDSFLLDQFPFDNHYTIFVRYNVLNDNFLFTTIESDFDKSNFGLYGNFVKKFKILYTAQFHDKCQDCKNNWKKKKIPVEKQYCVHSQIIFEKRLFEKLIEYLNNNINSLWLKIANIQAQYVISKPDKKTKEIKRKLKEKNISVESDLYKEILTQELKHLEVPFPKTKWYFNFNKMKDINYFLEQEMKYDKRDIEKSKSFLEFLMPLFSSWNLDIREGTSNFELSLNEDTPSLKRQNNLNKDLLGTAFNIDYSKYKKVPETFWEYLIQAILDLNFKDFNNFLEYLDQKLNLKMSAVHSFKYAHPLAPESENILSSSEDSLYDIWYFLEAQKNPNFDAPLEEYQLRDKYNEWLINVLENEETVNKAKSDYKKAKDKQKVHVIDNNIEEQPENEESDFEKHYKFTFGYITFKKLFNQSIDNFEDFFYDRAQIKDKLVTYFKFDTNSVLKGIKQCSSCKRSDNPDKRCSECRKFHKSIDQPYHVLEPWTNWNPAKNFNYVAYFNINKKRFTDGADIRLWTKVPSLDFTTGLLANQNTFHSRNLINLGFTGSKIYYQTHGKAEKILELPDKNKDAYPCPKTDSTVQIPLRMTYLIPFEKYDFSVSELYQAFDQSQIDFLLQKRWFCFDCNKELVRPEEANESNKPFCSKCSKSCDLCSEDELCSTHESFIKYISAISISNDITHVNNMVYLQDYIDKKIIKNAWLIYGRKAPERRSCKDCKPLVDKPKICPKCSPQFPIYKEDEWLNRQFAIEIVNNNSLEYNSKVLVWFVVGDKRILNVDMHINPNSRNLLNIELFETSLAELESNTWILKDIMNELMSDLELTLFSRNVSLNYDDMKLKKNITYQREVIFQAISHMILRENIRNNSQCKLGNISITGQIRMHETCDSCKEVIHNLKLFRSDYSKLNKKTKSYLKVLNSIQNPRSKKKMLDSDAKVDFTKQLRKHFKMITFENAITFVHLDKDKRASKLESLQDDINNFKCKHNILPKDIMPFIKEAIIDEYEHYLKQQPKKDRFGIQAKIVSPSPHRTSRGTTTNHWKTGIHLSLYIKDKWWYTNKLRRMSKSREIDLTPSQSVKLLDRIKVEDTLRYEVTIWGFEQIHDERNHRLISELEQFIVQTIKYFKGNKEIIDVFKKAVSDLRLILPKALYSEEYETEPEKFVQLSGSWIDTSQDTRGYTILDEDPPFIENG